MNNIPFHYLYFCVRYGLWPHVRGIERLAELLVECFSVQLLEGRGDTAATGSSIPCQVVALAFFIQCH